MELQRDRGALLKKSLNTQAVERRSLSDCCSDFQDVSFPIFFFAQIHPTLQATPFYRVLIQEVEFLPTVSNAVP